MKIEYSADNEIANFREICMGSMAGGMLYRGSYPIMSMDPERDRAYDRLVKKTKITCVVNLSDNESGLETTASSLHWYRELLDAGKIIGLDIRFLFDFDKEDEYGTFKSKLRQAFQFMITHAGPCLIHCNAGTDRTGFLAAIIEGLFGAEIEDIVYDYLLSHGKEFADDRENELNFTTGNIIYNQLNTALGGKIYDKKNFKENIENYIISEIGLPEIELYRFKKKFTL
ncbi:MAG: tyrosine-protein phosphatase [Treponema sp.]|nr:tyrosine-protein phosphatase [Treponema sp.]